MATSDLSEIKEVNLGGAQLYFPRGVLKRDFPFQNNEIVKINVDRDAKAVTLTKPEQSEIDAYNALMMQCSEEDVLGTAVGNPPVYLARIKYLER